MERIGEEQKMTVKQVADVLGVSERVIQKHASTLGLTKNGKQTELDEKSVTIIKKKIERSGRSDLAHVCELPKTQLEKQLIIQQAMSLQNEMIQELQAQLEEAIPKAKNWDDIASHETFMNFRDAAGKMGVKQNELMKYLKTKYIYKNTRGEYRAFSEYQHLFSLRPYTNGDFLGSQLMLTADGYLYFNKKVNG
jgi:hypothetical protein